MATDPVYDFMLALRAHLIGHCALFLCDSLLMVRCNGLGDDADNTDTREINKHIKYPSPILYFIVYTYRAACRIAAFHADVTPVTAPAAAA